MRLEFNDGIWSEIPERDNFGMKKLISNRVLFWFWQLLLVYNNQADKCNVNLASITAFETHNLSLNMNKRVKNTFERLESETRPPQGLARAKKG